jgi:hypothetical protein
MSKNTNESVNYGFVCKFYSDFSDISLLNKTPTICPANFDFSEN